MNWKKTNINFIIEKWGSIKNTGIKKPNKTNVVYNNSIINLINFMINNILVFGNLLLYSQNNIIV